MFWKSQLLLLYLGFRIEGVANMYRSIATRHRYLILTLWWAFFGNRPTASIPAGGPEFSAVCLAAEQACDLSRWDGPWYDSYSCGLVFVLMFDSRNVKLAPLYLLRFIGASNMLFWTVSCSLCNDSLWLYTNSCSLYVTPVSLLQRPWT